MDLSETEAAFLRRHGFTPQQLFDGRKLSKRTREAKARELNLILVLTSSFCAAGGHRIRTRAGHCAQCKPSAIGFTKRERSPGYVYIAASPSARLLKVGTAVDLDQRETQLRAESYGGFSDWKIIAARMTENAGLYERNVCNRIAGERVVMPYTKNGEIQYATEIIRCSLASALDAFEAVVGEVWNREHLLRRHKRYGVA